MNPIKFSGSYDGMAKLMLVCQALPIIAVTILMPQLLWFPIVVTAFHFVFAPLGYAVTGESIQVKRIGGGVRILRSGLLEVRLLTPEEQRNSGATFGSNGLFGYFGWFRSKTLGKMKWYVTNRKNCILLRTADGLSVISPDDTAGFLSTLGVRPNY